MIRVDVAYALIYREDEERILMVNNIGGGWTLPGGAVEQGETFEQAVIREVKEETNLTIEAREIVAVNEAKFEEKGHHALFITFRAKVLSGEIAITFKDEISEVAWVDVEKANELMPYHSNGVAGLLTASAPYTFQG